MNNDSLFEQNPTPPEDDPSKAHAKRSLDPDEEQARIEELEAQVKELSVLVEVLMDKPARIDRRKRLRATNDPNQLEISTGNQSIDLMDGLRGGMEWVLGIQKGETLESRIGSIWLPRGAVILFMTVLVLGIRDESIAAMYKVSIGYFASLCFVLYGLYINRKPNLFSNALLGTGLATAYFMTYGIFFIPETQIIFDDTWAIPSLVGTLVAVALLLYYSKSETATAITFILTYYTVVLSLNQQVSMQEVRYALLTSGLVSVILMFIQMHHRGTVVSWIALLSSYTIYSYYFAYNPPYLDIPAREFQFYSISFLTVTFVAHAVASIGHVRNLRVDKKRALYFGGLNFGAYLFLTWYPVRDYFPDVEAMYRAATACMVIVVTIAAQRYGTKNSSIMQLYLCIATVLMSLALYTYLPIEWSLIGFAAECMALSLVYRRFPLTVLKTLHAFLLVAIFAGSMSIVSMSTMLVIDEYSVPVKWLSIVSVVTLLAMIAWYYDNRVARYPRTLYHQESHWFLANRRWNWSPNVVAVMNTTAGALILTAMTITDLSSDPVLPFMLAGEGLAFALVGLVLRTPQMELSSVLMLVSAHVTFHFFWMTDKSGFATQTYFLEYTATLALVSYLASYFWERYLQRIEEGTAWEHDLLSSIPFVASILIVTTYIERTNGTIMAPLAQVVLGLVLMLVGRYSLLMGLRFAAVTALSLGCINFYIRALDVLSPNVSHPQFAIILAMLILSVAITERVLYRWELKVTQNPSRVTAIMHSLLITAVVLFGGLGLWHWSDPHRLSLHLLSFGISTLIFGILFSSSRYRIGALLTIFAVCVRLYIYDLSNLAPLLKLIVFGIVTVVILLISWGYSRLRAPKVAE